MELSSNKNYFLTGWRLQATFLFKPSDQKRWTCVLWVVHQEKGMIRISFYWIQAVIADTIHAYTRLTNCLFFSDVYLNKFLRSIQSEKNPVQSIMAMIFWTFWFAIQLKTYIVHAIWNETAETYFVLALIQNNDRYIR